MIDKFVAAVVEILAMLPAYSPGDVVWMEAWSMAMEVHWVMPDPRTGIWQYAGRCVPWAGSGSDPFEYKSYSRTIDTYGVAIKRADRNVTVRRE